MNYPERFIKATHDFCTLKNHVSAPYFRKSFEAISGSFAELIIGAAGFYELFINGKNITKSCLAPYISNPDHLVYYDVYNLSGELKDGENVIGVILGNGMQNPFGGHPWSFEKSRWIGAPRFALSLTVTGKDGNSVVHESDTSFKTSPSPILFDDLRYGEVYDARKEIYGWNIPGFNDAGWSCALPASSPRGDRVISDADPIKVRNKLSPVSITLQKDGYLYDFGINTAGSYILNITGSPGQEITLLFGEYLKDGILDIKNLQFEVCPEYMQKDYFICSGRNDIYSPVFTYHGYRYVFVSGITQEQATDGLLTYLEMSSDLAERGGFRCSDATANTLQELTRRSSLSNFYYFPTDCPHREKNGWTGDAALSAEHMLLNLQPEKSFAEWLRNIRYAQNQEGVIPGIIPTGGWGYDWNGPAWDCVLIWLPYYTYIYRGDKKILEDNATAIFRYTHYLNKSRMENGLIKLGLGDWCPPDRKANDYLAPLEYTGSVISMDICKKAAFIFGVLGMEAEKKFCGELADKLRADIRRELINTKTGVASNGSQTAQAMAIFYGVFDDEETDTAFKVLLERIKADNGHMNVGILGGRTLFHVLSSFGEAELAYKLITQKSFPSYGYWVEQGATTLWEDFHPAGATHKGYFTVNSLNHHFWGDISGWFIKTIAGINPNPGKNDVNEVRIKPEFIRALDYAEGFHILPVGRVEVAWKRENGGIKLIVNLPYGVTGEIIMPEGYIFKDGKTKAEAICGEYSIIDLGTFTK